MQLRSSPMSPYARMVIIAADVLGLAERLTITPASVMPPDGELATQNPLGKIPVLVPDNGRPLYDSRVIIDYLDSLAGGDQIIPAGVGRHDALCLQALAIGMIEAAVLQVYERRYRPPERQHQPWVDAQAAKVNAALAVLEQDPPARPGASHFGLPDVGQIALACALGYLDFRFEGAWRAGCPKLAAWLDVFAAKVPAFGRTRPPAA
ncbi:glutathione S-transferase family protein [Camelimonas abortus]|uniref:Glutathione S-transferase family protein n=1 Tax=Camelimonas abortus TaxID=1017184 RepID=A0ABV7LAV6_9HYPH